MKPDKCVRGIVALILVFSVVYSLFYVEGSTASNSVFPKFYVDDNYDNSTPGWQVDHFDSIQDAIDSPDCGSGDRIIVYSGTYYENLIVNKSVDIFGEDRSNTIIDGQSSGDVITVTSSNVDISTFTIKGSGSGLNDAGVKLNADNCRVVDNIIQNCKNGVFINGSDDNTVSYNAFTSDTTGVFLSSYCLSNIISYNDIYSNSGDGVFLNDSCNLNSVSNNNIYSNTRNGVYLHDHCNNNTISANNIYSNSKIGIRVENSSNNQINENNSITSNSFYGILIVGADNIIDGNIISSNTKHGVFLLADNNTIVRNNTISGNTYDGIRMQNSTSDSVTGNNISQNLRYGIFVNYYALNNIIYNNSLHNNEYNARDISNGINHWNVSETACKNIINGPNVGGNFWSDYAGSDSNGDGIGDTVYEILGGSSTDYLPLMFRRPTANTGGPYSASTGESITFDGTDSNSPDGSIISYIWDFGDGSSGSGYRTTHTYSTAGTYTVTLIIRNNLGGSASDTTTATITPDTTAPTIDVYETGSTTGLSNIFIFSAHITDNVNINKVWMQYWYEGSEKMTAFMENTQGTLYKKVVTTQGTPDKVFCVIYANDTSENQADTKNPHSDAGGSYTDYKVLQNIIFNGSGSYDLDGNITEYLWDFGDGTTDYGVSLVHMFHADGTYPVKLTVTDDDENIDEDTVNVVVSGLRKITVSNLTKNIIETEFNITLTDSFSAFDTDADDIVDSFVDPNNILYVLHTGFINITGDACFLLSVNNDLEEIIIWDTEFDSLINVTHKQVSYLDPDPQPDPDTQTITYTINVGKANWTYIEIEDKHPDETLTIKNKDGSEISSTKIKRESNKIYFLDDGGEKYTIIYSYSEDIPTLDHAVFTPLSGSMINVSNPTITFSYDVTVYIVDVLFVRYNDIKSEVLYSDDIYDDIVTSNSMTFSYAPPDNLEPGRYYIEMTVEDAYGEQVHEYVYYEYEPYFEVEEAESPFTLVLLILGGSLGFAVALILFMRFKHIDFESFIYIKNRKIIPFFKPVIFGSLKIQLPEGRVSKAEFFVNGNLKTTVTEAPFEWSFNEPAFLKQDIETKIYDADGNENSTGPQTFFVFNIPGLFR